MRVKFTNESVIEAIQKTLEVGFKGQNEVSDLLCGLLYANEYMRNHILDNMNILTQSAFEVSFRFDSLLKAIITTWEMDSNKDYDDVKKAKDYIMTNVLEVSRLIQWTETSETLAMDYLISKEAS